MESTLEGPATLEALMMEYDGPPQNLRKKSLTAPRLQRTKDNDDFSSMELPSKVQHSRAGDSDYEAVVQVVGDRYRGPTGEGSRSNNKDDMELISLHPDMEEAGLEDEAAEGAVSMVPGEAGGGEPGASSDTPQTLEGAQREAEEADRSDTGDIMSSRESELYSDGEGEDEPGTESNAQEEDDDEPEMTQEEKKAMSDAVCDGNIDLLDDLLDLPGADINMEWFGENLLMAAIRSDESEMAIFLLDNGINRNYEAARLHMKNPTTGEFEWFTTSCRQMAYDCGMMDVVNVIDELNNNKWPFLRDPQRTPRIKRPLADKLREKQEAAEAERKRREEMHARYVKRRSSVQEVTSEEASSRDNASVTSHTSYNSSFGFSDATSVRGDRKRKQSKAEPMSPLLAEEAPGESRGKTEDGTSLPEGEEGEEEEEETGPFFVPLGPTHMFPYPAEEEPVITVPHHHYRANRTFISRRDSNAHKLRAAMGITGSGAATPVERSPSVGSYRAESLLWTPSATPSQEPSMASTTRPNGRHTSLSTRLMSPWKDDDPEVVAAFQKRSKSASTAGGVVRVGGSSGAGCLPGRIRSSRTLFPVLNAMPQLTALTPGGMTPRRDNFMTPTRSLTNDIINQRLTGLTPRHMSQQATSRQQERSTRQSKTKEVTMAEGEDTGVVSSQHMAPPPPHTSMTSHKDAALVESDSRTPSGRSRPPRSHSPAGYLRAFSAGRRQPAPVIHIVVPPT